MATDAEKEIQTLIEQASKQFRNREFGEANRTYQSIIQKLNHSEPHTKQKYINCLMSLSALAQTHLKFNDRALQLYTQVLQKDPLNVTTLIRRGVLYMKIGQYQKSCIDLQRGLMLQPDNHRIQFYIQELNEKLTEMNENSDIKYPLKRRISEIVRFPQVQEDMLLNFSNLKSIDKQSVHSSKSVSIMKQPTATIEVQREFDMNTLLAALVKEVVLTPQQIREIEKQNQIQLQPNRLQQDLNVQRKNFSPVKIFYDNDTNSQNTQSILKSSMNSNLVLHPLNKTSSSFSDTDEKQKRVSALQVKNIDGKVLKNNTASIQASKGSDDEDDNSEINFGQIEDIQKLGKKEVPVYKTNTIKRKSSMRKGASIITKPEQKSQFVRGRIDLFSINIDGPLIRHQSSHEYFHKDVSEVESSESPHVTIMDQPSDIETSDIRKSNYSKQQQEIPSPIGIGDLKRKSSILKNSKRRFEQIKEENQNIEH